jgi:hypothetical protein
VVLFLWHLPAVAPLQVPEVQSEFCLQVAVAHCPTTAPLQLEPALTAVQVALVKQLVGVANWHLPAPAPLQVPVPQSAFFKHPVEQVPVTTPPQVALALRLAQSALAQQLVAAGTQLPIVSPLQVPAPQSPSRWHDNAEQVPSVPPLHACHH